MEVMWREKARGEKGDSLFDERRQE